MLLHRCGKTDRIREKHRKGRNQRGQPLLDEMTPTRQQGSPSVKSIRASESNAAPLKPIAKKQYIDMTLGQTASVQDRSGPGLMPRKSPQSKTKKPKSPARGEGKKKKKKSTFQTRQQTNPSIRSRAIFYAVRWFRSRWFEWFRWKALALLQPVRAVTQRKTHGWPDHNIPKDPSPISVHRPCQRQCARLHSSATKGKVIRLFRARPERIPLPAASETLLVGGGCNANLRIRASLSYQVEGTHPAADKKSCFFSSCCGAF